MKNSLFGLLGIVANIVTLVSALCYKNIVIIICCIIVFIIFRDFIYIYRYGIKKINHSGSTNLPKEITSIKIMAITGNTFVTKFKNQIINAVKDKIEVQVILADTDSEFISELSKIEDKKPENLANEIAATRDYLKQHENDAKKQAEADKKQSGRVSIRYSKTQIKYSMIIVNDKTAWITLNLPPEITENSFSLTVNKIKSNKSVLAHCIKYFDSVWKISNQKEEENND